MLDEQTKGCDVSKGDYLSFEKRVYISRPLFLEYLFFFVFFKFLTRLKKNKRTIRYKGGNSVLGKKTSPKHMEHTDDQCKETFAG
jgi:hypothetical protein